MKGNGGKASSLLASPTRARNLSICRFGDFIAVDHVSFTIKRGEVFGFLGSNGGGKSTTIRMFCGLLAPTEGTAHVAGLDIRSHAEEVRSRIGSRGQDSVCHHPLEVMSFMALPSRAACRCSFWSPLCSCLLHCLLASSAQPGPKTNNKRSF